MSKVLFTVLLDFEGVNSISQFSALDPMQALRKWQRNLNNPVRYGLKPNQAKVLAKALEDGRNEHVETDRLLGRKSAFVGTVNEVTNVRCVWLSVGKKTSALINIVATSITPLPSKN
jgi:hypothetical protein